MPSLLEMAKQAQANAATRSVPPVPDPASGVAAEGDLLGQARLAQRFAQSVETSPLEAPDIDPTLATQSALSGARRGFETGLSAINPVIGAATTVGIGSALGINKVDPTPDERLIKAAEAGVMFDKPAPVGHYLASLAFDEENRLKAYELALRHHMNKPTPVRRGRDSGMIEYFREKDNRFSIARPPGHLGPTMEGLGGMGMILVGELGLGLPVATVSKSFPATLGAAAIGAVIGEITRLKTGQHNGINQGVTNRQILLSALKEGGISAFGGAVAEGAIRGGKLWLDLMDNKLLPGEVAKALKVDITEARQIVREVHEFTGTNRYMIGLAEATGDQEVLILKNWLANMSGFRREFAGFGASQREALDELFAVVNRPFSSRYDLAEAGAATGRAIENKLTDLTFRENAKVASQASETATLMSQLKTRAPESLGHPIRDIGTAEQEAFRQQADALATHLDNVAGNTEFIDMPALFDVVKETDEKILRALFPAVSQPKRSLIGTPREEEVLSSVINPQTGRPFVLGTKIGNKLFDPGAKLTFREAWEAISDLKRVARQAGRGLATETPDVAAVERLYIALEKDLRASAQAKPGLGKAYDDFIKWYREGKDRLDRGTFGDIMTREGPGGRWRIEDMRVFETFWHPRAVRNAQEVKDVIQNSPEAMDAMRHGINEHYRRNVAPRGRPDPDAHAAWLESYRESASLFFNRKEMKLIEKIGGAGAALQAREQARDRALARINQMTENKFASLKPQEMVKELLQPGNDATTKAIMDVLDDPRFSLPDIKRGIQAQVAKEIKDQAMGGFLMGERVLDHRPLKDFLYGKGGEKGSIKNIREIFGDKYADNLDLVARAMTLAQREAPVKGPAFDTLGIKSMTDLVRAQVGIFTTPGRVLTAALRIKGRAANRVMVNALLNPDILDELIQTGVSGRTAAFTSLVGSLGGSALLHPTVE